MELIYVKGPRGLRRLVGTAKSSYTVRITMVGLTKTLSIMRKHFSSQTLKKRFSAAWSCLPDKIQNDLYKFIRQIREVENIKGTYIGCPDGTRYGPLQDGEGYTFLYKDDEVAFCDIILSKYLVEASQAIAISVILHELGHALDYSISPENTANSNRLDAEVNAWDKAILWAKEGLSDPTLTQEIEISALYAKLKLDLDELTELTKAKIEREGS